MGRRASRPASRLGARGGPLDRLILDTTILVEAERRGAPADSLIGDEDDVAVAAITAAELLVGVELADAKRRPGRKAFVDSILSLVPVEPYDLGVARIHAGLLAHARLSGRTRRAHDLIIAATGLSSGRIIVSADPQGFDGLPGVRVRFPS
ncbi:MAG: PIN domain-containing protein [Gaiellales bacterium]